VTRQRRPARAPQPPERLRLNVSKGRAKEIIDAQIAVGLDLATDADDVHDDASFESWTSRFDKWRVVTNEALRSIATTDEWRDEFDSVTRHVFRQVGQSEGQTFAYRQEVVPKGVTRLEGFVERLAFVESVVDDAAGEARPQPVRTESRSIFVVHGRDDGLRETVARFLERLGFEPIILAEQPNEGRTLIAKFEANALDVGFAVVLMTPDDYAVGPEGGEVPSTPNRARQNVVLELGYFMGRLGRARVAALYKPGTETPSDIHGLAYVPMSDDGWRFVLAKELRAAGYEVDFNLLG
jgi:predicted nucleotide-binding protein